LPSGCWTSWSPRFWSKGTSGASRAARISLANLQRSQAGDYAVVISSGAGSVTSRVAQLFVVGPPQIAHPGRETGQFSLDLYGDRGQTVLVQASTDLQHWKTLGSCVLNNPPVRFTDSQSSMKTQQVKPTIYTDTEMKCVAEKNAPAISAYRDGLGKMLANQPVQVLPHEQIIGKLDEAGKTFKVLLINTPLTKPYTSVFFQLECGDWNAGSEKQLRDAMKATK
jgi:hypothetical protein